MTSKYFIAQALFLWTLFGVCSVHCQTHIDQLTLNCKEGTIVEDNFGTGRSFTCNLNDRRPPTDNIFRAIAFNSTLGGNISFTYAGCVEANNNNLMCVTFNPTRSIDDLVNKGKICTKDGNFCFHNNYDTCEWYFADNKCRLNCPNLLEIAQTCGF